MINIMDNKGQNPKINDLIFRELIKRGYSLEGNTRIWNIADSKLWYLTSSQAQAFLDLEKSKGYNEEIIQKEIKLINNNMPGILKMLGNGPHNLIDLGCGDGRKATIFINKLKENNKVRYCPIDISSYMVDKAIKNISKEDVDEIIKFQWNISDFENIENVAELLRNQDFKKNFFLLLGNTLGNFEINELIYEIRSAMGFDDVLLIGNGVTTTDKDSLLESYHSPEMNNFLIKIPLQLGLSEEDVEFGSRFQNQRIELFYTLKKSKTINFQNKEVIFNKGDQIIVAVSYHYDKESFINFMKMYFGKLDIHLSKNDDYALAICKK
jgi:uncharacterized SAM-dependent methyltransferase